MEKAKRIYFDSQTGIIDFRSDEGRYAMHFGKVVEKIEEYERRIKELKAKVAQLQEGS